uniref:Putative first triple gene block protein n=1 Tax=Erysiphe necator associated gora-like virus 1 TaxID=2744812 RepID=A0A8E4CZV7_9VIRU|nr:putative first triple gene block protein [Erysiphe necator associated gora-like virus 1]
MSNWRRRASSNQGGKDVAAIVSRECSKAGFEATGVPARVFEGSFFEDSGFLPKFKNYLVNKQFPKACSNRKGLIKRSLDQLDSLEPTGKFRAATILGVPGSGKTTLLTNIKRALPEALLVYPNVNLESNYRSFESSYYLPKILALDIELNFSTVLVDEYTLCESAELLLLQRKVKATRIFLFGDRGQGNSDSLVSPEWLQVPCIYEKISSHRYGGATSGFLKKVGLNIEGSNDIVDSVEELGYEGESEVTDINLCFSEKTKADLQECGIDCSIVNQVQGSEFESATVFIADWDSNVSFEEFVVGFTRHRKKLIVRSAHEVKLLGEPRVRTHKYV